MEELLTTMVVVVGRSEDDVDLDRADVVERLVDELEDFFILAAPLSSVSSSSSLSLSFLSSCSLGACCLSSGCTTGGGGCCRESTSRPIKILWSARCEFYQPRILQTSFRIWTYCLDRAERFDASALRSSAAAFDCKASNESSVTVVNH